MVYTLYIVRYVRNNDLCEVATCGHTKEEGCDRT